MRWPHFLRCHWTEWGEKEEADFNVLFSGRIETGLIQQRLCRKCGKVQIRRLRAS